MQAQNDTDATLSTIIEYLNTKQACLSGLCLAKSKADKRRLKEYYDSKLKSLEDHYREKLAELDRLLKKEMQKIQEENDKLKMDFEAEVKKRVKYSLMNLSENVSMKQNRGQPIHSDSDTDSEGEENESDDEPKMVHASSTTTIYHNCNLYLNENATTGKLIINQKSTEEWLKIWIVNLLNSYC